MPGDVRFTAIRSTDLPSAFRQATRFLAVAKPGYTLEEAQVIVELALSGVRCSVRLEQGEMPVRAGWGETEALKLLVGHRELLNLGFANGLSLCLITADNMSHIFAHPLSEGLHVSEEYPNGIIAGKEYRDALLLSFGLDAFSATSDPSAYPDSSNVLPTTEQPEAAKDFEPDVVEVIKATIESLEANPPQQLQLVSQVKVYRGLYKLLKVTAVGVKIGRKRISLGPFSELFRITSDRLRQSWLVFSKEDESKLGFSKRFEKHLDRILGKYTLHVGRFGYLVPVEHKDKLEKEITGLTCEYLEFLSGEAQFGDGNRFLRADKSGSTYNTESLNQMLMASRRELCFHLESMSWSDPDIVRRMCLYNKRLGEQHRAELIDDAQVISLFIDMYVDETLNFPSFGDITKGVSVIKDYYDISDEMMASADFTKALDARLLHVAGLREYSMAFEPLRNA